MAIRKCRLVCPQGSTSYPPQPPRRLSAAHCSQRPQPPAPPRGLSPRNSDGSLSPSLMRTVSSGRSALPLPPLFPTHGRQGIPGKTPNAWFHASRGCSRPVYLVPASDSRAGGILGDIHVLRRNFACLEDRPSPDGARAEWSPTHPPAAQSEGGPHTMGWNFRSITLLTHKQ